jgi:hypothetical protein
MPDGNQTVTFPNGDVYSVRKNTTLRINRMIRVDITNKTCTDSVATFTLLVVNLTANG